MEPNGHEDDPFKDKSNTLDLVPGPEASPLPDPPPRRQSLARLKENGTVSSRRSFWENQTSSKDFAGIHPLSKSMSSLQPTSSLNSLKSSVSSPRKNAGKWNRKTRELQENCEVSSQAPAAPGLKQRSVQIVGETGAKAELGNRAKADPLVPRHRVRDLMAEELPAEQEIAFRERDLNAVVESVAKTRTGKNEAAREESVLHLNDSSKIVEHTDAPAVLASNPQGNNAITQNDCTGTGSAAAGLLSPKIQPLWKRFSSAWKRTPATDKKSQVDAEASLCTAGAKAQRCPSSIHDDGGQPSAADDQQPQATVVSPEQDFQSPGSIESLSPNYSEAREPEPRRCSEVKMMNLNCMSESIQDLTTYSAGHDMAGSDAGNSLDMLTEATSYHGLQSQPNAVHSPTEALDTADSEEIAASKPCADVHVQASTGVPQVLPACDVEDMHEPCIVDDIQMAEAHHGGARLHDADFGGVVNRADTADKVINGAGHFVSAQEFPVLHPVDMDADQEGRMVLAMAHSGAISPSSGHVVSSPDREDPQHDMPSPASFAVDISLDGPALQEAMEAELPVPQDGEYGTIAAPYVSVAGHHAIHVPMPDVHDSFSFAGTAKRQLPLVGADDMVASLAQLPFGGLVPTGSDGPNEQAPESNQTELAPPQISEEPLSCAKIECEHSQGMHAGFMQVSLADECGLDTSAVPKPVEPTVSEAAPVPADLAPMFSDSVNSQNGLGAAGDAVGAALDCAPEGQAQALVDTTAVAEAATPGSMDELAGASNEEAPAAESLREVATPHASSSMLPPRHPSPGPASSHHGTTAAAEASNLTIRPGASSGQDLGLREAVEQALQSSPTARRRSISPGGARAVVGRCGDSIPLFVKDLPAESLLDDTNMEEWLSPSIVQAKTFGLLDDTMVGDAADIEKVCNSIRAAAEAEGAVTMPSAARRLAKTSMLDLDKDLVLGEDGASMVTWTSPQTSAAHSRSRATVRAAGAQLTSRQGQGTAVNGTEEGADHAVTSEEQPAPLPARQTPSLTSSPAHSASVSVETSSKTTATHKNGAASPTSKLNASIASTLKSAQHKRPAAHSLRSPRSSSLRSTTAGQTSPLKSLRLSSMPKPAASAPANLHSALKSPRGAAPVLSSIPKTPRRAPANTSSVPKTPRGAPASTCSAPKTPRGAPANGATSSVPRTPRGTSASAATPTLAKTAPRGAPAPAVTSSVPKTPRGGGPSAAALSLSKAKRVPAIAAAIPKVAQRGTSLPHPPKTPRGTVATAAVSKIEPAATKLGGSKSTPRSGLLTATAQTPRGTTVATVQTLCGVASSALPKQAAAPADKSQAQTRESSSVPAGTPRRAASKRPLSSPVSANRLRAGRPVPVTPQMDKSSDVHMEDASPAMSLLDHKEQVPVGAKPRMALVPKLNFTSLAATASSAAQEQEATFSEKDMEMPQAEAANERTSVALPLGDSNSNKEPDLAVNKTPAPGNGVRTVSPTPLEAWTPELYMPATATPATSLAQNKGLAVYNANFQATPFRMLSMTQLEAAINAPLIDSSPLCWDEQDFNNDTRMIIMQLATSPAPVNAGTEIGQKTGKAPKTSPAPSSLMEMQVQMLLQQLSEYKTKMQQLETDNLALKDQISTMQFGKDFEKEDDHFEKDARMYAESELHKVQSQNTQLAARVQQLEHEGETAKQTTDELQQHVQELTNRITTLEKERNDALDQVGFMEVEVTALRSSLAELQQQLGTEQAQMAELNAALVMERDERVKLIKDNQESKKDVKKLLEKLITAQTEHQVALKEVEKANALVDKLQHEKHVETLKVAQLNGHLEQSKAEANELMAMCSELLALQEAGARK